MNVTRAFRKRFWLLGMTMLGLLAASRAAVAADFTVTSPDVFKINNTGGNPTIILLRGQTYTFEVNTTCGPFGHPFQIVAPGVTTGNNTCSGTITYTVPMDAPATNSPGYVCSVHFFSGDIITVDPPTSPPPTIKILSLTVGTNLTLVSTGTNTWTVNPEFSTNLLTTNWYSLTVQSNRFLSGTNETYCGKPPGDNVFVRVRSSPQ
jgi:hypothetical protein